MVGTAVQRFEWDGLYRQTKSVDENIPGVTTDDATVTYAFDSLSRPLEEVQNGQPMSHRWSADDDKVACVYPEGRIVQRKLDRLDRIDELTEGGGGSTRGGIGEPVGQLIARYRYIGMGRVATRRSGNGTELTFLDDAGTADVGYDLVRRVVRLRHRTLGPAPTLPPQAPPGATAATTTASSQVFADFAYAYNRMNYRAAEIRNHQNAGEGDVWRYDSVYRVGAHVRDVQNPLAELGAPGTGGTRRETKTWQLDGLGNWDATVTNGGAPSAATNNDMNEYTAFAGVAQTHDDNGNLTDDGTLTFAFDALNRMRSVTRKSDGALLALYSYDAHGLGRRVKRELTAAGASAGLQQDGSSAHAVLYFYDGARVVEEHVDHGAGAAPMRQYVDGNGIDEHLQLFLLPTRKAYWYHEDAKGWVAALTKPNGNLEERRVYDTYGVEEIQDASGQVQANRFAPNLYGYHGRRLDPESGLLYFRARQYDPVRGRFVQRDPIGAWATTAVTAGNPYAFLRSSPLSLWDPLGLDAAECTKCCDDAFKKVKDKINEAVADWKTCEKKAAASGWWWAIGTFLTGVAVAAVGAAIIVGTGGAAALVAAATLAGTTVKVAAATAVATSAVAGVGMGVTVSGAESSGCGIDLDAALGKARDTCIDEKKKCAAFPWTERKAGVDPRGEPTVIEKRFVCGCNFNCDKVKDKGAGFTRSGK